MLGRARPFSGVLLTRGQVGPYCRLPLAVQLPGHTPLSEVDDAKAGQCGADRNPRDPLWILVSYGTLIALVGTRYSVHVKLSTASSKWMHCCMF